MIERAIAADVPFAWVAADSVYGVGDIEMALRRAGKGYVASSLSPASSHPNQNATVMLNRHLTLGRPDWR